MQAGILDRRVQLLRASIVDDGLQQRRGVPAPLGPVIWAARRDVSDGERFAAAADRASVETRWRVRWSPATAGITTADALQAVDAPSQVHQIVAVKEIGRRYLIEISTRAAA